MENVDYKEENKKPEGNPKQGIYSQTIRAGKRTYFFDVKSTRNNEYYLTITESKRKFSEDGSFRYEKHKLFLYPEDFDKFADTLQNVIGYIQENQPADNFADNSAVGQEQQDNDISVGSDLSGKEFTDIKFEDI